MESRVQGLGFSLKAEGLRLRVEGQGFRVMRIRVEGLGFRV